MTAAVALHPDRQPLWGRWAALLAACSLVAAVLVAWRSAELSAQQQRVEQQAVLQEIGRSLVASLERSQQFGIPLRDTVGLQPWMAEQITASPQVSGLAVVLVSGEVLARQGVSSDALRAMSPPPGHPLPERPQAWVRLALAEPGQASPVAWLHVVGTPHDRLWRYALVTLLLATCATLLAAVGLRRWLDRQVGERLARIRHHLEQLAEGQLVAGRLLQPPPGHHRLALTDQALAARWGVLKARQAALLQKLNEVRAAHFDSAVLARIDTLAGPLLLAQPGGPAADRALPVAVSGWARFSLNARVFAVLGALWVLVLVCGLVLESLRARQVQAAQGQAQVVRLGAALDQALGLDLARLTPLVAPAVVDAARVQGAPALEMLLPPTAHWWRRSGAEPAQSAAGPEVSAEVVPSAELLAELARRKDGSQGLWTGADRQLQVGVARAVTLADGSTHTVVVAQPFAATLAALTPLVRSRLALADHRGYPLAPDPGGLIAQWQAVGRQPMPLPGAAWRVSVPLMSHTGHTLGHLVAELPSDAPETLGASATVPLSLLAALWLALGAGIALVLRQLRPLGAVAQEVARLAESPEAAEGRVQVEALRRDIGHVHMRLEALRALRRSRDRQGRRQARFIRHQMLELASRLDEAARADVLQDLQRIESAGLHAAQVEPRRGAPPADPRFERVADEVGVLALGFQSLVGRVGDQYQQLGQLVRELREALQVKTQFIAIQQELEIARKMQLAFLPHDFSGQPGVELHGVTQPAREVGGDFYDFFRLDAHHLAVLVADVSGKGVPAAFFMAISRTLMRAVAQFSQGPADCLTRLNDLLAAENEEMMFVTLFYAVIDTRDGRVAYGNAGHNPPYVIRRDGRLEPVPSLGDMPLAVMPGTPFAQRQLQLEAGDALFLYTDGVTEAKSADGHWFGEPRLEAFLRAAGRPAAVRTLSAELIDAVRQYEDGCAQSDDITCLTVRLALPFAEHPSPAVAVDAR